MKRRAFITAFCASMVWPLVSLAQQPNPIRLIGVLIGYAESDPAAQSEIAAFRSWLGELGWMEGRNLRIELRWGGGDATRVKAFARELVELRPDAILSQSTAVTDALTRETKTIPIVFVIVADPVASGFATSLARPGGNVSGFMVETALQGGKWVQLLKEIAPQTSRMALLLNAATGAPIQFFMPSIQAAASSLGVELSVAPVQTAEEIEAAIASQARKPGGGVIVMPSASNQTNRDLIIALATRYKVPAIYNNPFFAESGGLITYGADYREQFRQGADYIDRVLRGEKPGDLPVQAPTKFELVINLRAAKAMDLEVPPSLLVRADKVIE